MKTENLQMRLTNLSPHWKLKTNKLIAMKLRNVKYSKTYRWAKQTNPKYEKLKALKFAWIMKTENLQMRFFRILFCFRILVGGGVVVVAVAAHQKASTGKKSGGVSVSGVLYESAD